MFLVLYVKMNSTTPIILASSSPRRQEILHLAGLDFKVLNPDIKEQWPSSMPLQEVPEYLAKKKANTLIKQGVEGLIIAADTVVILNGKLLGKPKDEAEVHTMLNALSGKHHQVITGVCMQSQERLVSFKDTTSVTFKELDKSEINYYCSNFSPLDKAGAYGIQEWIGMIGVVAINGSFYNVMGLPIHKVYHFLKEWFSVE